MTQADLRLFDTMTKAKQVFTPADPGHVTLYVCGPTVYNRPHIGNARPAVVFDVLARLLRTLYPRLTYARNITDVDDKINAAAKAEGVPIGAITERFTAAYHADMEALGVLRPDLEPRATQHIPTMIALVESLMARGHAYEADGHVLFHVPSFPSYGALSHADPEQRLAGARVEVAPYKRDPSDFVLWKPSSEDLPGWDSPWGRGRPGWHLECTAMITALLGTSIDIHGGGHDLTFPHHENEIAQGRCAHGTDVYARFWMHNGFVNVTGEKMSKSLGNVLLVEDLLADHPGEVIRLALLSAHYRQPLDWTDEVAPQARRTLDRLYEALRKAGEAPAHPAAVKTAARPVLDALCDDLNTPNALAALHALARALNSTEDAEQRAVLAAALRQAGAWLGLLQRDPEAWFKQSSSDAPDPAAIEALIQERAAARKSRDFTRADAIRNTLLTEGIVLEDGPSGTTWKVQ